MPRIKMSLSILECIAKNEQVDEGVVLREFIRMIDPDRIVFKRISSKVKLK